MEGELVNLAVVERALLALAVGGPLAGLLLGLAWGALRRRPGALALQGLLWGLLSPAVWIMWRVYNAIEDFYGLDSVKALLINLALFTAVGVIVGAAIGLLRSRRADGSAPGG